jgi:hypothetical protein
VQVIDVSAWAIPMKSLPAYSVMPGDDAAETGRFGSNVAPASSERAA